MSTSVPQPRWFCHACQIYFDQPIDPPDPQCTSCHSSFVEELHEPFPVPQPPPGLWARSNFASFVDSATDDSPPIPSTRQRFEQQQQQQQQGNPHPNNRQPNYQFPFVNFIDPLINILSAPAIPDPPDSNSPLPSSSQTHPHHRNNPPSFSNIGDLFSQNFSPPFNPSTPLPNRSSENNENRNNEQARDRFESNPSSSPRPPVQGVYTFAFGSQSSSSIPSDLDRNHDRPAGRTPSGHQPRQQPANDRFSNEERFSFGNTGNLPQQPFHGILSLLQSAFGLNSNNSNNNSTSANDSRAQGSNNPDNDSEQNNESASRERTSTSSSGSGASRADMNANHPMPDSHPRQPRPTPRSPRVNVEESHPLRQFINILNSLNQSDGPISRNGVNGFVINGGNGFGFTTQFDMDQNSPFGQNLGDYVTSDSTMQDILNQLINMTGVNGAHNPIPASESTIKSLKRFKFDSSAMENEEPIECAICKDTFAMDDGCMELPCKHFFHDEDCITPWLKQNGSCPVCRYSLVNNHEDSEADQNTGGDSSYENNHQADSQRSRRTEDEETPMNLNNSDQSSSHSPSSAGRAQYPRSSNWTDEWEVVDQLQPQFDFD